MLWHLQPPPQFGPPAQGVGLSSTCQQRSTPGLLPSRPQQSPALLNPPVPMASPSSHLLRQGLLRGPYICSQPGTSSARGLGRRDESGTVPKEQLSASQSGWPVASLARPESPPSLLRYPCRKCPGLPSSSPIGTACSLGLWTVGEESAICCAVHETRASSL